MHALLVALLFAILRVLGPGWERAGDARAIVEAVAQAVEEGAPYAPALSSHVEDASLMLRYAVGESSLRLDAVGDSGRAYGAWQLHGVHDRSAIGQARAWLYLLHLGAETCPESPAAPLSGGCTCARRLADRRLREARAALSGALR